MGSRTRSETKLEPMKMFKTESVRIVRSLVYRIARKGVDKMRKALVVAIAVSLLLIGGGFATAQANGSCNINWSALSPCNWHAPNLCAFHCDAVAAEPTPPAAEVTPPTQEKCSLCNINWSALSPCNWHWPHFCPVCGS